jgi:hypothetical protein
MRKLPLDSIAIETLFILKQRSRRPNALVHGVLGSRQMAIIAPGTTKHNDRSTGARYNYHPQLVGDLGLMIIFLRRF